MDTFTVVWEAWNVPLRILWTFTCSERSIVLANHVQTWNFKLLIYFLYIYIRLEHTLTLLISNHQKLCITNCTFIFTIWKPYIDWLIIINCFTPYRQYFGHITAATINKRWSFVKFGCYPGGPHEPTLQRNPVKRFFACQGGCYPWHGAPFNVQSDGHRYIKNVKIFKFCCKNHTPAKTAKYH